MSGILQRRGRGPRTWCQLSACSHPGVGLGMVLAVVVAVVAGLLAMHALTASPGTSGSHASGHVHTGDHHHSDEREATAGPATSGAASLGLTAQAPKAGPTAPTVAATAKNADHAEGASTMLAAASAYVSGAVGHEHCPGGSPGHCPHHLHALTSMCQAVLTGAGVVLLLLLLGLGLAAQRRLWGAHSALTALACSPHSRWSAWRRRLGEGGLSLQLHELCVSRT